MELHGHLLDEELINKLTRSPEIELWGMLKRSGQPVERKLCREPTYSSLGILEVMPTELLFSIIEFLDFRSLLCLMRVSSEWKMVVEALPAYAALTKHAQGELGTLGLTGIIKHHSASVLYRVLLSPKCVSCFEFAGFLFLPTCERICFACLLHNQAYWVLPMSMTEECFSLTKEQILTLPIVHAVPGAYFVGRSQQTQRWSGLMVSIKQAKLLANKVHGSSRMTAIKYIESKPYMRSTMYQQFHHLSLKPPGRDLSRVPIKGVPMYDNYCGTAAIRFPYVKGGQVDNGRLCRGCEYISRNFDSLPIHVQEQTVPPGMNKTMPLQAMATRLRTRGSFIDHISSCYGVKRLLAEGKV
ncbi:hypothetical protein F4678DRAFT_476525 [Xylaria arbuscula]|nr:hypothetical protein F4678DRAFT_476525 [Xylaria arbuscula]